MDDWLRITLYFAALPSLAILAAWLCRQADRHYDEARRLMEEDTKDA